MYFLLCCTYLVIFIAIYSYFYNCMLHQGCINTFLLAVWLRYLENASNDNWLVNSIWLICHFLNVNIQCQNAWTRYQFYLNVTFRYISLLKHFSKPQMSVIWWYGKVRYITFVVLLWTKHVLVICQTVLLISPLGPNGELSNT